MKRVPIAIGLVLAFVVSASAIGLLRSRPGVSMTLVEYKKWPHGAMVRLTISTQTNIQYFAQGNETSAQLLEALAALPYEPRRPFCHDWTLRAHGCEYGVVQCSGSSCSEIRFGHLYYLAPATAPQLAVGSMLLIFASGVVTSLWREEKKDNQL